MKVFPAIAAIMSALMAAVAGAAPADVPSETVPNPPSTVADPPSGKLLHPNSRPGFEIPLVHDGQPIPAHLFNARTIPKELRDQFYHELGLPSKEWFHSSEQVDSNGKVKLVGRIGGRFDPSQEEAFLKEHWGGEKVRDEL